jgi:LytR cell envelope-related transcriptional attenuator
MNTPDGNAPDPQPRGGPSTPGAGTPGPETPAGKTPSPRPAKATTPSSTGSVPQTQDPTAAHTAAATEPAGGVPAAAVPKAATREGAWGAVARLLALQLLTVIAVTALITGIYALTGGHDNRAAGSSSPNTASGTPTSSTAGSRTPSATPSATPAEKPPPTSSPSSSPTSTSTTPVRTHSLKVDVLNQSASKGSAGKIAVRVRELHWPVGRVDSFRGTVSATTVYYPPGKAAAARELARGLPGSTRVLPRFSTLSDSRLTVILVR